VYDQEKMSRYSWKRALYDMSSSEDHAAPMVISSIISGLMEILILTVGEMLAMLPSSKVFGARIGLLNQSMCPDGIKYLVLITHMEFW
jgi:hypothetical protein